MNGHDLPAAPAESQADLAAHLAAAVSVIAAVAVAAVVVADLSNLPKKQVFQERGDVIPHLKKPYLVCSRHDSFRRPQLLESGID